MNIATGFDVLSREMAEAKERAKALDALDEAKREWVRLAQSLYEFARLAYESRYGWKPEETTRTPEEAEKLRILLAGNFAGQCLSVFDRLVEYGSEPKSAVLIKLQKVSDWLKARGLNGIPEFVTESASTVKCIYKSATQMCDDMAVFVKFAAETRREAKACDTKRRAA